MRLEAFVFLFLRSLKIYKLQGVNPDQEKIATARILGGFLN
jgi:hypothetical protein